VWRALVPVPRRTLSVDVSARKVTATVDVAR
jgi:hypothetical protein